MQPDTDVAVTVLTVDANDFEQFPQTMQTSISDPYDEQQP